MDRTVRQYLSGLHERGASHRRSPGTAAGIGDIQIAFYGGNFTGLSEGDQEALLRLAAPYIAKGFVGGIRISTRPDHIRREQMAFLRKYSVRTVEIGAQSLVGDVLSASRRGHTAADVSRAVALLKAEGFEVGLHLMAGLPGDTPDRFAASVEAAVFLAPDMIRIHPTLVLRDTPLAAAYERGEYMPLSLEEAVHACKCAVNRFAGAGITVIRVGLQTTAEMEQPGAVVAGPFHPAFGALVESSVLLDQATAMLGERDVKGRWVTFHVPARKESSFRGQRNENLRILTERFGLAGVDVIRDEVFHVTL